MTVLLIEDDPTIRLVLNEALSDEGYEVRQAADGRSGLIELEAWTPSVIVLDLMMPGMDGWAFRTQQRELKLAVDVPVVIVSASRRIDDVSELNAVEVLAKPFELDDIIGAIERARKSRD
jgi:DNA-binding response OmpR family regulator